MNACIDGCRPAVLNLSRAATCWSNPQLPSHCLPSHCLPAPPPHHPPPLSVPASLREDQCFKGRGADLRLHTWKAQVADPDADYTVEAVVSAAAAAAAAAAASQGSRRLAGRTCLNPPDPACSPSAAPSPAAATAAAAGGAPGRAAWAPGPVAVPGQVAGVRGRPRGRELAGRRRDGRRGCQAGVGVWCWVLQCVRGARRRYWVCMRLAAPCLLASGCFAQHACIPIWSARGCSARTCWKSGGGRGRPPALASARHCCRRPGSTSTTDQRLIHAQIHTHTLLHGGSSWCP